ncbi:MAG: OmpA family protein [Desulfobacteraceae bacterium]|nr:OmpA family protein [Desulfobacteraceae bacterium]
MKVSRKMSARRHGLLFFVFLFVTMGLVSQSPLAYQKEIDNLKNNKTEQLIVEYKSKLIGNQMELLELRENIDWLTLKIKKMTDLNLPIRQSVYDSLNHKMLKVEALEKERKNYLQLLKGLKIQARPDNVNYLETEKQKVLKQEILTKLEAANLTDWLEFVNQKDRKEHLACLKTVLPILFSSGSAVIPKEYQDFLKNLATLIKTYEIQIVVDGYADVDPIHTAKFPTNFELGATRAANVVHALEKYGVKRSVFRIATPGKNRFSPQEMSKNKALERYVDITVVFSG